MTGHLSSALSTPVISSVKSPGVPPHPELHRTSSFVMCLPERGRICQLAPRTSPISCKSRATVASRSLARCALGPQTSVTRPVESNYRRPTTAVDMTGTSTTTSAVSRRRQTDRQTSRGTTPPVTGHLPLLPLHRWLGSRVVSMLDSGAVGPGFKSQLRRCRVTDLGKLLTLIVPLFTKQRNRQQPP